MPPLILPSGIGFLAKLCCRRAARMAESIAISKASANSEISWTVVARMPNPQGIDCKINVLATADIPRFGRASPDIVVPAGCDEPNKAKTKQHRSRGDQLQ
jgi:hypothetical protein